MKCSKLINRPALIVQLKVALRYGVLLLISYLNLVTIDKFQQQRRTSKQPSSSIGHYLEGIPLTFPKCFLLWDTLMARYSFTQVRKPKHRGENENVKASKLLYKSGFKSGLTRSRVRHSIGELLRTTSSHT